MHPDKDGTAVERAFCTPVAGIRFPDMWVEFVGSLLCFVRFFLSPKIPTFDLF